MSRLWIEHALLIGALAGTGPANAATAFPNLECGAHLESTTAVHGALRRAPLRPAPRPSLSPSVRRAIYRKIDWSAIEANAEVLGYERNYFRSRLKDIYFNEGSLLIDIRRVLGKEKWTWQDLSTEDVHTLFHDQRPLALATSAKIVEVLPYLPDLGVDLPRLSHDILLELRDSHAPQKDLLIKQMAWWRPLWFQEAFATDNLLALIAASDHLWDAKWLLASLSDLDRATVVVAVQKDLERRLDSHPHPLADDSTLSLLLAAQSFLPKELIPAALQSLALSTLLNFHEFPPLKLREISSVQFGGRSALMCDMMTRGHMCTLGMYPSDPVSTGRVPFHSVLIRVKGHLIGSLKLTGDNSMLALQNVVNENGDAILVLGGVYQLPYLLVETLGQLPPVARGWPVVDLPSLKVTPLTFLFNRQAWLGDNSEMIDLVGSVLSREDVAELRSALAQDDDQARLVARADFHARIWPRILLHLKDFAEANAGQLGVTANP